MEAGDAVGRVRQFYEETVNYEWRRLDRHRVEFELSKRYILRYAQPGDRVLDLGGGPGKYALHLAGLGCHVTLADLSRNNVEFAARKAQELGVPLTAVQADGRDLSGFADESFDHVLCMGPMYHLQDAQERRAAIEQCLRKLKPGGTLFVAFVSSYSFVWDYLLRDPALILDQERRAQLQAIVDDTSFTGYGFADNYFIRPKDAAPFFEPFGLELLHVVNCESFLYLREDELLAQPPEVVDAWLDLAEAVCEREDLLSMAEHVLYVGRKQAQGALD